MIAPLRLDQDERLRRLAEPLPSHVTTLRVLLGELPADTLRRGFADVLVTGTSALKQAELAYLGAQLVAAGDRDEDDLFRIVRQSREFGEKRVRLYQLAPADAAQFQVPAGAAPAASHRAAATSHAATGSAIRYSEAGDGWVRIVATERHEKLNRDDGGFTDVRRVVTLEVNRLTGLIAIACDPAGDRHPHGRRSMDYYNFYERLFLTLLPATATPLNLVQSARALLGETHLADLTLFKGRDDEGPFTIPRGRGGDARSRRLYATAKRELLGIDVCGLLWKKHEVADGAPPTALTHRAHTKINTASREVLFDGLSLATEFRYVCEHIRLRA